MARAIPREGKFRCTGCSQIYVVPQTTLAAIRKHMRETHNIKKDTRWVRRRLK